MEGGVKRNYQRGGYREASRLTLEVTSVRVERLQDITEQDAVAEGVEPARGAPCYPSGRAARALSYRAGFVQKWDKLNGKRAPWLTNPWVWVVGFRRIESEDPCSA